jgi:hypothetical protein
VKIRGYSVLENLHASTVDDLITVGSNIGSNSLLDYTFDTYNSQSQNTNFNIIPSKSGCTFSSLTPSISSVDSLGKVSYVSSGTSKTLITNDIGSIVVSKYITNIPANTPTYLITGFINGSFRRSMLDTIAGWVSGKTYNDANSRTYTGTYPNFQRNPNAPFPSWVFAASSLGFYGGTNANGQSDPMHLISSRHAICAKHWAESGGLFRGLTLYWLDTNNVLWPATCVDITYPVNGGDICVVYLSWNNGQPPITPYYFLPYDYISYIKTGHIVFFSLACNLMANIGSSNHRVLGAYGGWVTGNIGTHSIFSTCTNWTSSIISGDSSGPVVYPITIGATHYPTLATALYTPGGGPDYGIDISMITTAMNAMSSAHSDATVYTVQTVPLAGNFTAY